MQDTERITEVHDTNAFLPCARFLILRGCLWHSVPSQNRMCAWFFFSLQESSSQANTAAGWRFLVYPTVP